MKRNRMKAENHKKAMALKNRKITKKIRENSLNLPSSRDAVRGGAEGITSRTDYVRMDGSTSFNDSIVRGNNSFAESGSLKDSNSTTAFCKKT